MGTAPEVSVAGIRLISAGVTDSTEVWRITFGEESMDGKGQYFLFHIL